ncbi:MAG TPA: hypothetical protein VME17_02265 [Bryobacteraceae bacterium]|nr:hypothetical protein [Bryobacteraceae bacterium]
MRHSTKFIWLGIAIAVPLLAQPPFGGPAGPPADPKAAAPIDMTGYWVSLVTEDWRYRMVTPRPGDYYSVPMTPAAITLAETWDPAKDEAAGEQCKSYGAPAIMRVPEHLHITWQDDHTMQMETDAGKQTRLFHFGPWMPSSSADSLQGDSVAEWEMQREGRKVVNGSLKVMTTHLKAGYLRKNGVPYSANAKLEEYYDMTTERNGDQLLVVTTIVTDPMYLREPFIVNEQFKKMPDSTGWDPTACSSKW